MIDLKSILLGNERVIGLQIKLPFTLLIFIFNTKGFLCGNMIDMKMMDDNKACICMMKQSSSYEECLNSEVISCNQIAIDKGIRCGMKGKKALMMMHED